MDTNCLPKTDGYGFEGGSVAGQAAFSSYQVNIKGGGRRTQQGARIARRSAKRTARRSARRRQNVLLDALLDVQQNARQNALLDALLDALPSAYTRSETREDKLIWKKTTGDAKYSASLEATMGRP